VIKILLVEDEPDILDLTAYVLRRERFVVIEASDGEQALRRWKTDRPDLVVLDLGLPRLDGFEVLRRIRDDGETPILVLTARRENPTILRSFNLGSDDFMPKPFEYRELTARIRAILRRAKTSVSRDGAEPRVEVDGLTLDPEAYEVGWRDSYVRLTPTEFRILYLLVTNAGHVVSANRLYTYVWGSDGGDANALRSHMSHLRGKLVVNGEAPGTIASVPGVGYVFRGPTARPAASPATPVLSVAPVVAAPESASTGPSAASAPSGPSLIVVPVPPA
jgi:DNA-binding response OmpR family regulator